MKRQRIIITTGWENFLRRHHLDNLAAVFASNEGEIVTYSRTTEVRRLTFTDGDGTRVLFLKKYSFENFRQAWKGAFRGVFLGRSKARREYENLRLLQTLGIGAATAIAFGEQRRHGWLQRCFLLTEAIAEPLPLDLFIRDFLQSGTATEQGERRRNLIENLAAFTQRMHRQAFAHHDLFWRNIIQNQNRPDCFYLIDAPKGRCWSRFFANRSRAKDLATLDAAAEAFFRRSERLRFFLKYTGRTKLSSADKNLVRRILQIAAPLRALQLRRVFTSGKLPPRAAHEVVGGESIFSSPPREAGIAHGTPLL